MGQRYVLAGRRSTLGALAATLAALLLSLGALALSPAAQAAECATKVTPYGPCGMNLEEGWSHYSSGDPEEVVAYIEGGINWHLSQAKELVDNIYVNWHETPVPCSGETMVLDGETQPCHAFYSSSFAEYDVNHDGVVNAQDWEHDPRVHDSNGNGYIDPEDLTVAFSDGVDHDHNGYVNDVSGWDFYDNQNDSATEDSTYAHSDNQMLVIHRECPKCMIMPVKGGDEALDRTDDLAKAWLFAADDGASVIVSVTADLGYSSFMREAISYLEKKGVAMVEASNDFDSTDHQGGMFWPYVLPGNGAVPSLLNEDEWIRSDYTSWGAKNVLTGATSGGTTSESTPTVGGAIALLQAWSRQAAEKGLISSPLTGPETEQELIATAKRITNEGLGWPGGAGEWNPQYGYGIPNVYLAMKEVAGGNVVPVTHIDSPDWYTLYDPTTQSTVKVSGTAEAPRSSSFHWVLQAGLGGNPQSWFQVGTGSGSGSFSGHMGTLKLSQIPESFWKAAFSLSKEKELETSEQYAVTLRVTVTDASGRTGVDRRTINVVHDPSWTGGFPMKLSSSGDSQPALADLQGSGRLDAVFATSDGYVDAIDPVTHKELKGWPVHTAAESVIVSHEGVSPGYEPIFADVAVGDLQHDGNLDVIAATEDGRVYVWNAKGELQPGWPQTCDTGVKPVPIPRPALPYTRLTAVGVATGGPVLYPLAAAGKLDVMVASWDGYIHVWQPDGSNLSGWPVKVEKPEGVNIPESGYVMINDEKLDTPPAIAYLEGRSSAPDVVMRSQYTETRGSGVQELPLAFVDAYHANGAPVSGWPVKLPGTIEYYGSAQEFLTEGSTAPIAADPTGTGSGPDDVAVGAQFSPPDLVSGPGAIVGTYGAASLPPFASGADVPTSFTTSSAFGKLGSVMSLGLSEIGSASLAVSLEAAGSGQAISNEESAFPASGGPALPGFPANRQGANFLGQSLFAPVTAEGGASEIGGGDSGALGAYTSTGSLAGGFPKWTTGWTVFSPTAGDLLSSGHVNVVSVTREGYLFAWNTEGPEKENTQWWRGQHDEWNTGNYEAVTRPPGAIRAGEFNRGATSAKFTAPGSAWYEGTPSSYQLTLEPQGTTVTDPATVAAGNTQEVQVPAGTKRLTVRAVGPTDLLGTPVRLK